MTGRVLAGSRAAVGLVGEHEARLVDDRARDRDPLALADRELGRRLGDQALEVEAPADVPQKVGIGAPAQLLDQLDVLADRKEGQQRAGLRQIAHVAGAQPGQLVAAAAPPEAEQVDRGRLAVRELEAQGRIRHQREPDQLEQRALAAAVGSGQQQPVARLDRQPLDGQREAAVASARCLLRPSSVSLAATRGAPLQGSRESGIANTCSPGAAP